VSVQNQFITRARSHYMDKLSGQTTLEISTDIMEVSDPLPSSGSKIVEIAVSKPRPTNQSVRDIVLPPSQSDSDEFCLSMSTDQDSVNLSLYVSHPKCDRETPNKHFKAAWHQKKQNTDANTRRFHSKGRNGVRRTTKQRPVVATHYLSTCLLNYLLTYLSTYLLHGTGSFFRG